MAFSNPRTGLFSPPAEGVIDQAFFDAAFAGRISGDKIYKESYNCNLTNICSMSTWLEEFMGYDTTCDPEYTLIETNSVTEQVAVKTTVVVAANPATTAIAIANANHYVGGNYILPRQGNTLVSPKGVLMEVVSVSVANNASTVTVRIRDVNAAAQNLTAGDELLVLSGSFMGDCECPEGNFSFQDLPIEHDLTMITIGDKGELCGDALLKCQWLKIPFTDECGNVYEKWYTQALEDMYRRFETRKHFERLLNPNFGIIPVLKARGQVFTQASSTEITLADVQGWKADLQKAGLVCNEYAVFAGRVAYQQWQNLLFELGGTPQQNVTNPTADCTWITMEYCGLRIGGLTLHIYEDCSFSNGKELGGVGSTFPQASIFVPLCNRRTNCRGGNDEKMLTTRYFKDNNGKVWDNDTDSNGVLNGEGGRNTFGAGCEQHEWTIKSRFVQEVHCPQAWGIMNMP
jgi:hypothetical protein